MLKKSIIFVCLFGFFGSFLLTYAGELTPFLKRNNSPILNDLFSVNVGIMKLKSTGYLKAINPVDSQNVVNGIKNILDKVPAARLSTKVAVLKAMDVYAAKLKETERESEQLIRKKLFFTEKNVDTSFIYEFFLKINKNPLFNPVAQIWFENFENPFYQINVGSPFERLFLNESEICASQKINDKPLDFLFYGEIEKIDELYFITLYVYSALLDQRIKEVSFVSDSANITEKSMNAVRSLIPSVFQVNYGSLDIDTEDEEVRIYLDDRYIGRQKVSVEFLVPGNYLLTLKKEDYEDKTENISIIDWENKKLTVKIEQKKELQTVDFYIEPLGSQIYINSLYQGKSPFKKALPKGHYIITARNPLYESYRYILTINEVKPEEYAVMFHLKSKNMTNLFKLKKTLYYTSFWNFSFALFTAVPLTVFAAEYFYHYYHVDYHYDSILGDYYSPTSYAFYGLAAFMLAYTALSLSWLFYALADYLLIMEKKDFIPILEYYRSVDQEDAGVKIGLDINF